MRYAIAFVVALLIGCQAFKGAPTARPQLDAPRQQVGEVSADLKSTTGTIRSSAEQGKRATPPAVLPILSRYWNFILAAATRQDGMVTKLDDTAAKLKAANVQTDKLVAERDAALKRAATAEASLSSALRARLQWLTVASVIGLGCASVIAMAVATSAALTLIPWLVGGLAVLALGWLMWDAYFDRLTHAMGLRTDNRGAERRRSIRIPACLRPEVYPVSSGILLRPQRVRARDISASGIGLLVPKESVVGNVTVIDLQPGCHEGDQFVIVCLAKRVMKLDSNWRAIGMSFERVLRPGQQIGQDARISGLLWVDVSGETAPEDPLHCVQPTSRGSSSDQAPPFDIRRG